jgi:peptidoglycan lytic transglycosylase
MRRNARDVIRGEVSLDRATDASPRSRADRGRVARGRALRRAAGLALLVVAMEGCAHARRKGPDGPPAEAPNATEVGLASFYGREFQGRTTASGATYDMDEMTCAHRTAPFGARLRVTDLETGRSVVVTVTDRGPFTSGRVVDLSLAAAQKLGIVSRGVARVKVERLLDSDRR